MNTTIVNATSWGGTILALLTVVVNLAVVSLCIYGIVLLIRLLKKGNEALNIYIEKNKEDENVDSADK